MSDLLPAQQPDRSLPERGYQDYGPAGDDAAAPSPVHLQRMASFLLKFWWIPVLTLLVSLSGAVAFILWAPPTFVSTGRMWETEKLHLTEGAAFTEDLQNYYGTQMELLQSDRMMQLAFESLQASGTNTIPRDKEGKPTKVKVKAKQQPKSAVFVLTASSANAEYAQSFLNSLMAVFQTYKRNIRQNVSGTTLSSIADQVQKLEGELKSDQNALAAFQRTNNLAILQEEGAVSGGYLARLKTQLSDLELEGQLLEATALEQDAAAPGSASTAPFLLDSVRNSSSSSGSGASATTDRLAAFREIELLKAQRDKLSKYFKPKHPKIAKLDADIERGQRIIDIYRSQTRDQLAAARQALQMKTNSVETLINQWEVKVVESKARIAEAERLRQNVTRSQGFYDRLMLILENVDITRNINQETLAILEPASPAERTYRQELQALGFALFVGLALGLGLVLLIEIRDDRFTSPTELTQKFGDGTIVGLVPEIEALRSNAPLLLGEPADESHMAGESYRSLRSALLFLPVETGRPKVVLITSALPNEGKSTIAANLARTIALGGSRVLLVDGDLRKGQLHAMLGLKAEPGLADLLLNSALPSGVLQTNCLANLTFISCGSKQDRPGDLLVGAGFDQLLAQWRHDYDYVLIDSCPIFAADDAMTIAPKADGALLVVRRRHSGARVVREALELLYQRQAKVIGLVFNRANASARSYYYYKYADYYGRGKGPKDQGTKGPRDPGT